MESSGVASHAPGKREQIKTSVGAVAGQRRRKLAVTLGKERRDAVVRGKRIRRADTNDDSEFMELAEAAVDDENAYKQLEEEVSQAVQNLKLALSTSGKGAATKKLEALRKLRQLLSFNSAPPIHVAVASGAVPILVDCLAFGSSEEQLLEAAWCLTNIASGELDQTRAVLPAVPLLIAHLGERSAVHVAEQCAWAAGNIAGEGEDMREILLSQGALLSLSRLIFSAVPSVARTSCWAMSNLIKGPSARAATELMSIKGIPECLVQHLIKGDEALVAEVAWILVYVTVLSDSCTAVLIHAGVLPPLFQWLASSEQTTVLTPILRTLGNIVSGENAKTDAVILAGHNVSGGLCGALLRCLKAPHRNLQKEGAWVVSNIAAGSMEHKRMLFTSNLLDRLVHLLKAAAFDVKKEAAYALGNLCVTPKQAGTEPHPILEHLSSLVARGCVKEFVNLVRLPDAEASRLGIQFIELVMRSLPNGQGPKLVEIEDGIAALETLQFHENEELRNMATVLLDGYFGDDYGLEEEYGSKVVDGNAGGNDVSDYPSWRRKGTVGV
ncbi:hypothetical protein O6H91_08G061400 [Diphasiastrum complanatum]|uniref:Uncharacterized protein n=1 Tax=Diphasiastrum complanatum TaxID=34168 RepID=A0ACC2CY27_DIPCM|nr:hypothetical protein O6H91_08G061400 [Diphasiastrum complanatum]